MKSKCKYCEEYFVEWNLKRHMASCAYNPIHKNYCPICQNVTNRGCTTCSDECRYIYFGHPNSKNIEETSNYRRICFHYHGNKCIICGEPNMIAVHHLDENRDNKEPCNLCPLCLTHHGYMHSKFQHLIEDKVHMFVLKQCKHMWE